MRTKVEYNGKTIAFTKGDVIDLHTEGHRMTSDIRISVDGEEGITPSGTLDITENGTHDVTQYASAEVNVPPPEVKLQAKTATTNGEITPDAGYDGLSKVAINVPPVPIEVSAEAEMNALLTSGTVGAVYKYTGATGTYENGELYVIEVAE